ncbi:MAG: Nramp family divalent metal transporter, partial [Chloroflexota bacterium]
MAATPRPEEEEVTQTEREAVPRPRASRLRQLLFYLGVMGPGLIAALAGNDAGGVATYASVGASHGYQLLWALALMTVSLAVVQEMSTRLGAVTGQGLADLIREHFGLRWTGVSLLALLLANGATVVSEFAGVAAAMELLGVSKYISVPLAGIVVWVLIVWGSYHRVEKVFLLMTLAFLAYPITVFLIGPDWDEISRQALSPSFDLAPGFLFTLMALLGTTITPYMQIFAQSATAEKGVDLEHYGWERLDAYLGALLSNAFAFFIIVTTAATLYPRGVRVETAADAAQALAPLAGPLAGVVFAIGLLGASLLAAGVLPLATAYPMSEALGLERGVSRTFQEAPAFMGIFTGLIVLGMAVTLIPGLPLIPLLILAQVVNGLLLPIILLSVVRLAGDRGLLGSYANGRVYAFVGWITVGVVSVLSVGLVVALVASMLG